MHSEQENNSFPAEFLERMKEMLGEEYHAFFESLGQERQQSFRINTGKTRVSGFLQQTDWKLNRFHGVRPVFIMEKRFVRENILITMLVCIIFRSRRQWYRQNVLRHSRGISF